MSEHGGDFSIETTVGIPTMNNESTIERTLRQLQDQTLLPDRVIIVDNSSDRTPDIIREVASDVDFPIDVCQQSDYGRGVGAARAQIYDLFENDLLVCLDTENSVDNKWLETHVQFHETHPDYGVLSNSSRDDFDKAVEDPMKSEFFGQSNCSLKRSALETTKGWDPWMQRGEDWDLRIRLWTAGVNVWAKSEIATDRFDRNIVDDTTTWFRTKVFRSPSSVTFLRKYGTWYLQFHPLHTFGDLLSAISILCLLCSPIAYLIAPIALPALLGTPIALSIGFLYYKGPRKRGNFVPLKRDFTSIVVFFALGLSALYNLRRVGGHEEWNYEGFDGSIKK